MITIVFLNQSLNTRHTFQSGLTKSQDAVVEFRQHYPDKDKYGILFIDPGDGDPEFEGTIIPVEPEPKGTRIKRDWERKKKKR